MSALELTSSLDYAANTTLLVTMRLDHQLFGIPVEYVRDVLKDQKIARIPRAPEDIAGSINLRGRIVTVLNLRKRLGIASEYGARPMFVVVEYKGEPFGIMVDNVSEVLKLPETDIEKAPPNLTPNWREVSSGVCRLEKDLLVVVDVRALLAV